MNDFIILIILGLLLSVSWSLYLWADYKASKAQKKANDQFIKFMKAQDEINERLLKDFKKAIKFFDEILERASKE